MGASRRVYSTRNRRLRVLVAIGLVVVVVVGAIVFLGARGRGPLAVGKGGGLFGLGDAPKECPLTGVEPKGEVPQRPALAVKVENLPASRPQTGLSWADVVYEEPVEAGITRFIAVYQCQDAGRIEPVRSARLTDPPVLVQFGHPLFAYAGGVPQVVAKVREAGLVDVNFNTAIADQAYHRDPNRLAPHNLYTSTRALYGAARSDEGPPDPVFTYSTDVPERARRVRQAHVPFSFSSDVYWRWSGGSRRWLRSHGTEPHRLSDGSQVSATNVVVQMVRVVNTDIHDANGVVSPEAITVGRGKAYVFRNGRVIVGTWSRPKLGDVTEFRDARGDEIALAPGKTWVELVPLDVDVSYS